MDAPPVAPFVRVNRIKPLSGDQLSTFPPLSRSFRTSDPLPSATQRAPSSHKNARCPPSRDHLAESDTRSPSRWGEPPAKGSIHTNFGSVRMLKLASISCDLSGEMSRSETLGNGIGTGIASPP